MSGQHTRLPRPDRLERTRWRWPHELELQGRDRACLRRGPAAPTRWSSSPSCSAEFEAAPPGAAGRPRRAPDAAGRRRDARLPARDRGHPRRRLDRSRRCPPALAAALGRDHRPDRPQDGHQRAELRRRRVHGRLRGRQRPDLGATWSTARSTCATRSAGTITYDGSDGKPLRARATTRPRCSCARAAGTCPSATSWSTASRCPGALFDFGLYFFHCAQALLARGAGPYFYLPKMESHLEARLWNDVFVLRPGRARHAAGHDQGDGADRDACRPRSRWTRSSTSCATTRPA